MSIATPTEDLTNRSVGHPRRRTARHRLLGGPVHRARAGQTDRLVQRRRTQPDLPGGRPRLVPRRGVLRPPGGATPRGPGPARGRRVRLQRRALLLLPHPPRVRGADGAGPGRRGERRRRRPRPGCARREAAQADFFVNNYAGCSTGQQWDEISYGSSASSCPIFNISHPFLWGNKPDAGYLVGEEWDNASRYVADQLRELITWLEERPAGRSTGTRWPRHDLHQARRRAAPGGPRPVQGQAGTGDVLGLDLLHRADQLPAGRPGAGRLLPGRQDEIQQRLDTGVPAVQDERYRLYFDGIMNWNKLGFLVAEVRRARCRGAGRPLHPQRLLAGAGAARPRSDPLLGMAQHYLLCPTNHGAQDARLPDARDCEDYGVDGIVFHSTRTCRAFTGPQRLLAKSAQDKLGHPVDLLRGRRGRRVVLQGGDPREPVGRDARDDRREARAGVMNLFLGVDLGSTTAKAVVVTDDSSIVSSATVAMGAVSRAGMQRAVDEALSSASASRPSDLAGTISTGYGRRLVRGRSAPSPRSRAMPGEPPRWSRAHD